MNVAIDIEGAVSSGSECAAIGACEGTSSDQTCVYVVRVEELRRPFLVNRRKECERISQRICGEQTGVPGILH